VLSTLFAALYLTHVEVVLGITGAVAATTILFIMPPAIYLRLSPEPLAANAAEVVFCAVGIVLGSLGLLLQFI